jgi:Uma2 family endonuclease
MTAVLAPGRMTASEYLDWEGFQTGKHEFMAGEVFAMTEVRLNHNRISGNAAMALREALRGQRCGVFMADVKLRVQAADAYFYPDIVVTCDPRDLADGNALAVQHPWLVVEVLSDSTALYDRGKKFEVYRQLPSLTHYLLVEQSRPYAELFRKNADGDWVLRALPPGAVMNVAAPHVFDWPVDSLYESVSFESPAAPV